MVLKALKTLDDLGWGGVIRRANYKTKKIKKPPLHSIFFQSWYFYLNFAKVDTSLSNESCPPIGLTVKQIN